MRLVAAVLLCVAAPAAAQSQPQAVPVLAPGETLLEVEGRGEVFTRPDIVTFEAGANTTGATAQAALTANSRLIERLIATLASAGIRGADVRTRDLSVQPRIADEDRESERPRILGYIARNELEVRVRDLTKVSALLSQLIEAGANNVSGPRFKLSSAAEATKVARTKAVAAVRAQADEYAAALGLRFVRVLRVTEQSRGTNRRGDIILTGSRREGVPIEVGEIKTELVLLADFALAPR